jgi:hypothetical protein
VWEVAPWIGSVAGIVLVAWATARAAGRWAGWFVAFVLVCAGDRLLPVQFAADLHGATAIDVCVLDAFLVLLVSRGGRIGGRATNLLLCAAVAAFAAGGVASDSLLIPAGLLPFVLAGASQYWFSPGAAGRRIAATVLAVTVAAAVGAGIAVAAMHAEGVYAARNTIRFATWDSLLTNLTHLAQSTADLFNGDFGGAAIGARSGLVFACAVAFGWAVVLAFREGRRQLGRLRQPGADSVREAHVAFWAAAAALSAAAFVFSRRSRAAATSSRQATGSSSSLRSRRHAPARSSERPASWRPVSSWQGASSRSAPATSRRTRATIPGATSPTSSAPSRRART